VTREYRLISADSHVNPLPTIWAERIPVRFRERAPRVERQADAEVVIFEGKVLRFSALSASAGTKYEDYKPVGSSFEEGRKGGWDAVARIDDQDLDGVDAEVLFGGTTKLVTDDFELRFALMQAYNDWLADFVQTAPDRLVGIAEIPIWDLDLAVREARRARDKGLRGVILPGFPTLESVFAMSAPSDRPYVDPWYDPLWDVLEDLGLPAHMHLGARPLTESLTTNMMINSSVNKAMMAEPIASFIFSGALQKHPDLHIVSVESGVGWMSFLVDWMDHVFERHGTHTQSPLREPPSAFFRRQVHGTFIEDRPGIRERHNIGLNCIMWSSDYPHSDSVWPHSRKVVEEHFVGVPEEEKHQIVCGNAHALYGLP
jgi:predicted TIM-barrel fold metal-dependent hydrolase